MVPHRHSFRTIIISVLLSMAFLMNAMVSPHGIKGGESGTATQDIDSIAEAAAQEHRFLFKDENTLRGIYFLKVLYKYLFLCPFLPNCEVIK
jgi:hypothetical protein